VVVFTRDAEEIAQGIKSLGRTYGTWYSTACCRESVEKRLRRRFNTVHTTRRGYTSGIERSIVGHKWKALKPVLPLLPYRSERRCIPGIVLTQSVYTCAEIRIIVWLGIDKAIAAVDNPPAEDFDCPD